MDALTELPLGLAGRIYRSPMPFSRYDHTGQILAWYHQREIGGVVVLVGREECQRLSGHDLLATYRQSGWEVIHLPVADFGLPDPQQLVAALQVADSRLRAGVNLAVHCHAGVGRTGTFLACLAQHSTGMPPGEAIDFVRQSIPGAIETPEQWQLVQDYSQWER